MSTATKFSHGVIVFVLGWNLRPDSHLSVHSAAIEFTHHALPPATVEDMDSMNNVAPAHNLSYATVQSMTYLVIGSRRMQRFCDLEDAHSILIASEVSLKGEVADRGATVHRLDQ